MLGDPSLAVTCVNLPITNTEVKLEVAVGSGMDERSFKLLVNNMPLELAPSANDRTQSGKYASMAYCLAITRP